MALIEYLGDAYNPLFEAFTSTSDPLVLQQSKTKIVLLNTDNDFVTTITGTNLALSAKGVASGTITGLSVNDAGDNLVLSASGFSWAASKFVSGMTNAVVNGDYTTINALMSLQPVIVDASGSTTGHDMFFYDITSNLKLIGSDQQDYIMGGYGNDTISPGGGADHGDVIYGGYGSDRIDLSGVGLWNWIDLNYAYSPSNLVVMVDGLTSTMWVDKGLDYGTDTIVGVRHAINDSDGFSVLGSVYSESFIISGVEGYLCLNGSYGNDNFVINLNGAGTVRLEYADWEYRTTSGIVMNLATGYVNKDGYGGLDYIDVTDGPGTLQILATNFADKITGSDRGESFILAGGDDTLDGGGGHDVLRYDRSAMTSGITVNTVNDQTGNATVDGQWQGVQFQHSIIHLEQIYGTSYDDSMTLKAAGQDITLLGYSGNDTLISGNGNDQLYGGDGDDYLSAGVNLGEDLIDAGSGYDTINFLPSGAFSANGWFTLDHYSIHALTAISVNIDVPGNTGFIDKGDYGTTTLLNVQAPLASWGIAVMGTDFADRFNLATDAGSFISVVGGKGADKLDLSGDGIARIFYGWDIDYSDAQQALVINLETGVVANDGFGNAETITRDADIQLQIVTTTQADNITGSAGDDVFMLLGGNDTVRGGAGTDRVDFYLYGVDTVKVDLMAGTARGTYLGSAFTASLTSIEDATGTEDGNDILRGNAGANALKGLGADDKLYGDGYKAAYDLPQAQAVYRLYQATLDRAPDAAGQASWTDALASGAKNIIQVAAGFEGSQEFQKVYGALNNAAFVELMYQNVLNRAADSAGLASWTAKLDGGMSRAQVIVGFSESAEFTKATNAAATKFTLDHNEATWTDDVYRLYNATLARDPDISGFNNWTSKLGNGMDFLTAVSGFVNSKEFQNTYGALSNTEFVELLYHNVLKRDADAGGLASWLAKLDGGASRSEVVQGFAQSKEFITATTPLLNNWVQAQGVQDVLTGGEGVNELWGGILSDQFVFDFELSKGSTQIVHDFEAWDQISLNGFGYSSAADALSHMAQVGSDVEFWDQGVSIEFLNAKLADVVAATGLV
ncbi:MAG: DUF4214 domain-containing protein [Rhodobacteraceae bacterium]|nr:DUF4214 domain-containing protein [Paracoccaceae bacterium]